MSKLEDLVPPLDLCQQIPEGAFADSALVWLDRTLGWFVEERHEGYEIFETFPAPTLAEIMEALANAEQCPNLHLHKAVKSKRIVGYVMAGLYALARDIDNDTSATAALKLWMKLNEEKEKCLTTKN